MSTPYDYTTTPAVPIVLADSTLTTAQPGAVDVGSEDLTTDPALPAQSAESLSLPAMPATFVPSFIELDSGAQRLKLLNANNADVNKILQGTVGGQLVSYQVRAGTDAEDLPGVVHPANYDPATNAFVFVQL